MATLAGLAAGELVAALWREAAPAVVPVGEVVIEQVPGSWARWAIRTFGSQNKAVLTLGTLAVLFGVGTLVGLLVAAGRRAWAYGVSAGVGLVGVLAVLERPEPTFVKMLPAVAGTAVSLAVLAALGCRLPAGERSVAGAAAVAPPPFTPVEQRREFVLRASTIGLVALMIGGLGRVLRRRFDVDGERATLDLPAPDDPAEPLVAAPERVADEHAVGVDGVTPFVVPNARFYRIDTALVVPQVPRRDWKLRIHGMVDRELELTFDDVLAMEQVERTITLSCVSNPVGGDLVGNAVWQGVLLAPLLERCGVHPDATQVVSRSIDGWTAGSPTSAIMDGRDALLAIGMNGEPLPAEHGYPARLVVPGLYGYVSATKWVTEIELVRWEDFDAYWVPRGWAKEGPVKTMARIDRTKDGDIAGVAWAVHRGISRVEVRIDDGDWQECELAGVPSDDTWRQWRFRWADAPPGEHRVTVRAYDGDGVVQPPGPKAVAPDGAEGYHSVRFEISRA